MMWINTPTSLGTKPPPAGIPGDASKAIHFIDESMVLTDSDIQLFVKAGNNGLMMDFLS
jgi:hypothetical protein